MTTGNRDDGRELLIEQQIANIEFDIANSKPSATPMGLFRQHCGDLLAERRKLLNLPAPQPAPQPDGEWRVDYTLSKGLCINDDIGCVAHVYRDEATAAQIVADHDAQQRLLAALESEDFYNLMQAYRLAPMSNQDVVVAAFEAVKVFIRAAGREEG